jgi:hypothetical protein
MSLSAGELAFRLSFQLSPILFTGGIAAQMGGVLPIILITEAFSFVGGILSGAEDIDPDNFFANFVPVAGSTLIDQQIGKYPFANQAVAANAVITQPLRISLRMICPARGPAGYALKLATMTALQAAFKYHNASGGTYTIATPSFFYTNCLMSSPGMTDISNNASLQAQNTYELSFEQPLLTLQDAQQAQSNLMQTITNATSAGSNPTWSGPGAISNPSSFPAIGTVPAATNPAGSQPFSPIGSPLGS